MASPVAVSADDDPGITEKIGKFSREYFKNKRDKTDIVANLNLSETDQAVAVAKPDNSKVKSLATDFDAWYSS